MEQIKLNTIPSGVPSVCHISQFDNTSRVIRCHLFNGSDPLTLTGSETIRLFMRKSDNSRAEFEIESASGSFIDLVITSEMSDIAGDSECKFQITDSEKTIGTLNFKMIVEPDAYGESLKTRSISGPIATFETDLAEDLIKLDVDLEPIQDLHGYDNPWPAGGGKNIACFSEDTLDNSQRIAIDYLDENNLNFTVTGTYARCMYKVRAKAGSTVTVSFKAQGVEGAYNRVNFNPENSYSNYAPWGGHNITSYDTLATYTKTFTLDVDDFYVGFYWTAGSDTGAPKVRDFQVEIGSSATSFAPYSNICPISGHDSAQLFRTGKNLLKDIKTQNGPNQVWLGQGLTPLFGTFLKSGTYTIKYKTAGSINSIYYQEINASSNVLLGTNLEKTFTIDKSSYYRFWLYKSSGVNAEDISEVQLELGSTATDYEPYESDPTPITVQFGQTIYKGKLDSARRKIIVYFTARAIKTFPWTYNDTEYDFGYFATGNTVDKAYNTNFICECFKSIDKARGSLKNGELAVYNLTNAARRFTVRYDAISTVEALLEQFGDYLICYELAEPIEIDLTQVQTASVELSPVASFETTLARPLETSEHKFSCSQAEGTPTPDSSIPITGVSEITAYRTGKNLIDKESYDWLGNSNIIFGGTNTTISDSLILGPGTYTLYCSHIVSGFYVDNNSGAIKRAYNTNSTTFSINSRQAVRINFYITNVTSSDLLSYDYQLELGSTATEYEPYSGESITVSLGGTYYGGKLVQSEDGSRKIVLDSAHAKINELSWSYVSSWQYFVTYKDALKRNTDAGKKLDGLMCDIYTNRTGSQTGSGDIDLSIAGYQNQIRIKNKTYSDVTTWLAAVGNHDIVYPLETPIEVSLPDGDPLNAVVGENNVYCNTGDTALTYYYNMIADPIRIPALVGTNNVYSDAGDVDVEYYTTLEGGND